MNSNPDKLEKLKSALGKVERVKLAELPTPLYSAKRLSSALGGPRILFKREDLTGLACGGNKTRMFEFSLQQVVAAGYDTIIAGAAVQSNYCRQLAAACAKLGLDVYLIFRTPRGQQDLAIQGNLLLDFLAGARVKILWNATRDDQIKAAEELAIELKKQGRQPYIARGLQEEHIGYDALAYVDCFVELYEQLVARGERVNRIYVASSDSTHAGLLFAAEYLGMSTGIYAIAPMREVVRAKTVEERIINICGEVSSILNLTCPINPERIKSNLDYVGQDYGIITDEAKEAIKLVARTEGIFLDPVYSGKAMAGLVDQIKNGVLSEDSTVVFVHTGGTPSLFAYANEFAFEFED